LQSSRWDMHSDATSKAHKQYLGYQVNLDSGKTLSAGFIRMQTENRCTLLDAKIAMMTELSDIYDETKSETIYFS